MNIEREIRTTRLVDVTQNVRLSWAAQPCTVIGLIVTVDVDGDEHMERINLDEHAAARMLRTFAYAFGSEWLAKVAAADTEGGAT